MSPKNGFAVAREQRRYKRYIVLGTVALQSSAGESNGALLNFGWGGILVRAGVSCREGAILSLRFQAKGFPEMFTAIGQVVGTQAELLSIKFLKEPSGIPALVRWLEQENYSWSGVA